MSREKNQFTDALTTLASITQIVIRGRIQPVNIEVKNLQAHYYTIKKSPDRKPWYNCKPLKHQHMRLSN